MPARQLNPQCPAPQQQFNGHINNTSRMRKNMEQLRVDRMRMEGSMLDWRVDQSIQRRAQFSNRLQELKQLQFQFSFKCDDNNTFQVFSKPATG